MASWDTLLDDFYEAHDPAYTLSEEQCTTLMSEHITGLLEKTPSLMYDHAFVAAATGWLDGKTSYFSLYEQRLNDCPEFASKAQAANPRLIKSFDISSSAHYDDICRASVDRAWRLLVAVDPEKCSHMFELSVLALKKAYADAVARQRANRPNRFIVRFATVRILPLAQKSGMSADQCSKWKTKLTDALVGPAV